MLLLEAPSVLTPVQHCNYAFLSLSMEPPANSSLPPAARKPILLAALLSSVIPGAGQLLLRQKLQATLLLAGAFTLSLMYWPFRLPSHYAALVLLPWSTLGLCLLSGCAAILTNRTEERRPSRWWLLGCLLLAFVAAWGHSIWEFWASGFRPVAIPSRSMESTVLAGDRVLVDLRYYRRVAPSQGDIIIFRKEALFVIKRVMAVGGNTIQGKNGFVSVNGTQLNEPYARHLSPDYQFEPWLHDFGPFTLPPGKLFVMGDNRDISLDSRSPDYGPVDVRDIVGKPLYVITHFPEGSLGFRAGMFADSARDGKEIR